MNRTAFLLLLLTATVPCVALAWAGSATGATVSGQVTDARGAAAGGAVVRLVEAGAGTVRSAITNRTGRYAFSDLAPGTYDVTVARPGFAPAKVSARKVEAGSTLSLDVVLQPGANVTRVETMARATPLP